MGMSNMLMKMRKKTLEVFSPVTASPPLVKRPYFGVECRWSIIPYLELGNGRIELNIPDDLADIVATEIISRGQLQIRKRDH